MNRVSVYMGEPLRAGETPRDMNIHGTVDLDALTALLGDEYTFACSPDRRAVIASVRGRALVTVSMGEVLQPGETLHLNLGGRVYVMRGARWSLTLKEKS